MHNFYSFFKSFLLALVIYINIILLFSSLRISIIYFKEKVTQNLSHKLSFLIQNIEELRLITSIKHGHQWHLELTNHLISPSSEQLRFFILKCDFHI